MGKFDNLPDLGWFQTNAWMPSSFVTNFTHGQQSALGVDMTTTAGKPAVKLSTRVAGRTRAEQKLRTFSEDRDRTLITSINRYLAGEKEHPVVAKVVGGVVGKLGIDYAAAVFSAVSGAASVQRSSYVFIRDQDELWRVELLGKAQGVPTYVASYLLVDPFRSIKTRAAWVIHEQRFPLVG